MLSPSSRSRAACASVAGRRNSSRKSFHGGPSSLLSGNVTWSTYDLVRAIEARESRGDGLDLRVELVVGNQPVDVSVLLRARSIEIVGHEEDLECPARDRPGGRA